MTAEHTELAGLPHTDSVFGDVSLGYVTISSAKLNDWKRFLVEGIGIALAQEDSDHLAFRLDDHAVRLLVERGEEEDVSAVGLHIADQAALDRILERLHRKNVAITYELGDCARRRGVPAFHRFIGPKGMRIELYTSPRRDSHQPTMQSEGFVTDQGGLGHISLMTREAERTIAFWQTLFDARVSDTIGLGPGDNSALEVTFLRLNQRHHTIAVAATRGTAMVWWRW